MRKSSVACLISLLLTGAGCFKSAEPVVLPDMPDREPDIIVGDFALQTVKIEKSFVLNEYAECVVDIAYPDIIGANLPPTVANEADTLVARFIATALGSTEDMNSTSELDSLAQGWIEDCQNSIESEYTSLSDGGEELFTNLKRKIDIVYNITLNDYHLLTIGLDEQSYTGGAHPSQSTTYINIDRGGNQLLSLEEIIAPEHLKAFLQYEKTKLLATQRDNLYPEIVEEYDAFISNQATMTTEAQQTTYGDRDDFYLTPTSIVTYYNSYDIAPYAAGLITVELPYAEVKDYINMNGPLVPVIENL